MPNPLVTCVKTTLAAGFVVLALSPPVQADAIEDYSSLRIAQSLDDLCRALKFVERKVVDQVSWKHIMTTTQYGFRQTGRWTNDDFDKWLDELDAAAEAKADEVGCTQAGEAYLLKARGVASTEILQGLILAYHLSGLPEDDTYRRPLHGDQMAAAGAYQGFLQQVYREQFTSFLEYNRQAAAARLPGGGMPVCDFLTPPDTPCYERFGDFDDDYYKRMNDVSTAALLVNDVLLEVAAETAGYRLVGSWTQKVHLVPHLVQSRDASLYASVVDNGRTYKLDGGGEVFGVMSQSAAGNLRFMTFGTDAEKLRNGAVRLLVRSEPKPEGLADWEVFNLNDFRSLTFPFDGVLLNESCLGGPCFEFSPQATEAILATGFDEKAELWLSASADAAPAATSDWLVRNIFYPPLMRRMRGETPPAAQ
jgi:hypothetical protein